MSAAAVAALVTVAITLIGSVIMLLMVNYLPESPIQSYIAQANSFWAFAHGLGFFLPIDRMIIVFSGWVSVMFMIVIYKVVYELISKVAVE